jgi:DNA-binding transcriptional MocR family regulator
MLELSLSPEAALPLVDQIVQAIRTHIDDRMLRPGARLPPIRKLAEDHGISRFTVVEAYDRLVALGLLQSRRGSGFYVCNRDLPLAPAAPAPDRERAIDAAWMNREMAREGTHRVLAAGGGLPAAWLDEAGLLRSLRSLTRRTDLRPVSYGTPQGYAPLRAQLQLRLGEIGIGASAEQIVLTYGVHQSLDIVCRYFLRPGDCVFVDDPGYWNLFGNLRLYGVRLVGVPRTSEGPDTQIMETLLQEHHPRLFFTHSVLHNPTSSNLSAATAFRVLQLAERHDFMIVEDDIYGDLVNGSATRLASLDQLTRVIYTSSFSKTISGNLRVGFLACQPDLAQALTDVKIVSMMSSPELPEQLVHQLLTDGHYRKHLERVRGRLSEATARGLRMLERVGLKVDMEPRGGPFIWARVPGLQDTAQLARAAAREDIVLAPGHVFRPQNQPSGNLRFNVGHCDHPRLERYLAEALARL